MVLRNVEQLDPSLRDAICRLARVPHLLIGCDYDGTLAPIVSDPTTAEAQTESITALRSLSALSATTVAVVSGRALRDLAALSRLPLEVHLVGSHGSEFDVGFIRALDESASRRRAALTAAVRGLVDGIPGVQLEEKPAGVAVHVRRASRTDATRVLDHLRRGPARADGVFATEGKEVLELSVVETDKGRALDILRHQCGATAAIFIGDDVTDEKAFARLTGPDVAVKVGEGDTIAPFRIRDTREVALLLALLCEERAAWWAGADATPIEALTLLSDGVNLALLTPDGDLTWMCHPEPDSPAVFADLLGGPAAGLLSIHPVRGGLPLGQEYVGNTLIARTRWAGLTVTDYLDCSTIDDGSGPHITRLIRAVQGRTPARIIFSPRPEFGGVPTRLEYVTDQTGRILGVQLAGVSDPIALLSDDVEWELHEDGPHMTATGTADPTAHPIVLELRCGTDDLTPSEVDEPARREATARQWSDWAQSLTVPARWHNEVVRSALTLKALCHRRTGAVLAAATTSLPEGIGGIRNWDYRYCWVRDGAMTVRTLLALGSCDEAEAFIGWLEGVLRDAPSPERLHPLYTLHGNPLGPEAVLAQLPGYAGSRPVRVGNAAQGQVQLDVFGPVADLVAALVEHRGGGSSSVAAHEWALVQQMVEAVSRRWTEPDHGIWEIRDAPRQHVYTKVMCWLTVDRALTVAAAVGEQRPDWLILRDAICTDVIAHGWDTDHRAYVSAYDRPDLDAACLHVGLTGLLSGADPRFVSTVEAIEDELRRGPTVHRYLHDDGLPGREGGMHICTSWLIEAYQLAGREADALDLFRDLLQLAGPTGLLPEQYDASTGRSLGNHPQAYSHLGVIRCALALSR